MAEGRSADDMMYQHTLIDQLDQLKKENEQLKLEREITSLQHQISEIEKSLPHTSTPYTPHLRDDTHVMDRTSIKPKKLRWPDDVTKDTQNADEASEATKK